MSKDNKEILEEELLDENDEKELENEEEIVSDESQSSEEDIDKSDESKNDEYEKLKESYVRLQADFANYKRRSENEKKDIYKYSSEKLTTKLLTVLDNLDRALMLVEEDDTFTEGVKLVRQQLVEILTSEGLEEIESDGAKFDANLHHAVFMEASDEVESDHIIETFQKGYKLNNKVIRPAMVKVSE